MILFKMKQSYYCFQVEPIDGGVCHRCWCQVDIFHKFYLRIERIHRFENTVTKIDINSKFVRNEADDFMKNDVCDVIPFVDSSYEDLDAVIISDYFFNEGTVILLLSINSK